MNKIDKRAGDYAEACWAWLRKERHELPTAEEFDLHPFVARSIAAGVQIAFRHAHNQPTPREDALLKAARTVARSIKAARTMPTPTPRRDGEKKTHDRIKRKIERALKRAPA